MTEDNMDVQALGKGANADFLREMIGFAVERLMDLEVGDLTVPPMAKRVRSGSRSAMATANGTGKLVPAPSSSVSPSCATAAIPRLSGAALSCREGTHRRMQEAYVQRISTRSVDDLVKAMGGAGLQGSGDAQHRWKAGGGMRGISKS
jgi:hypothetical protein